MVLLDVWPLRNVGLVACGSLSILLLNSQPLTKRTSQLARNLCHKRLASSTSSASSLNSETCSFLSSASDLPAPSPPLSALPLRDLTLQTSSQTPPHHPNPATRSGGALVRVRPAVYGPIRVRARSCPWGQHRAGRRRLRTMGEARPIPGHLFYAARAPHAPRAR